MITFGGNMGEYASLPWMRMYYEVFGEGKSTLLMHGGACTLETLYGIAPLLSKHYRLILPERRGHGRTPDVEGPMTYEVMAKDSIAFMESLGMERGNLVGYSDGANVALFVALMRPDIVEKLILISGNFDVDGMTEAGLSYFKAVTPELFERHPSLSKLAELYKRTTPDGPDHFPVVIQKLKRMWLEEPRIPKEELKRITTPTLVVVGDRDLISLEHATEMYRSMPNAQLSVMPGASHALIFEKPAQTAQLILEFLEGREKEHEGAETH
jgi:pimeloyl-ACP methyl ester carboxylesterase